MDSKGITIRATPWSVRETIDRVVALLVERKITVYARINQQSEVQNAGLKIAPLEFVLFGNPKAGGPVMAENPVAALDLPLKIIAWEDAAKKVWIAYNAAAWLEDRHSLPHDLMRPLDLDALVANILTT